MSRKSKKKRLKYHYTKTEFMDIICAQCGLCPNGTEPIFCYGNVYKDSPKKFIRTIFKSLMEIKRWLINAGHPKESLLSNSYIEYMFSASFCSSNYCGQYNSKKNCEYLTDCISAFKKQSKSYKSVSNKKCKKDSNKRYVPQPYSTFFCNAGMESEVRRVINGNRIKQQN